MPVRVIAEFPKVVFHHHPFPLSLGLLRHWTDAENQAVALGRRYLRCGFDADRIPTLLEVLLDRFGSVRCINVDRLPIDTEFALQRIIPGVLLLDPYRHYTFARRFSASGRFGLLSIGLSFI